MNILKGILAYVMGIIGWILGIFIGVLWQLLYGGYQESNVIDIPMLLAENITPAIVSVFLSNYIFKKIFPNNNSKKINTIIFYVILLLNYGIVISNTLTSKNYSNFIYIITGVICVLYLMYKQQNEKVEIKKEIDLAVDNNENSTGAWDSFIEKNFKNEGEGTTINSMKK